MNLIILHGRLTAEPVIRFTKSQKKVASYTIAVNGYNGNTSFINCQCWGKSADFVESYLTKGKEIIVRGRLEPTSYESKGVKQYSYKIEVESHEFCGSKNSTTTPSENKDGFMNVPQGTDEDDPPFN